MFLKIHNDTFDLMIYEFIEILEIILFCIHVLMFLVIYYITIFKQIVLQIYMEIKLVNID